MRLHRFIAWLFLLCFPMCSPNGKHFGNDTVGRDPTWFPLELREQTPNLNAFTNALLQALNKLENIHLAMVDLGWEDLLSHLDEKKVASILSSLPPLPQNQHRYDFSDPFLYLGPLLVERTEETATSLEELKNKTVGVYQFDDSVLIVQTHPSILIEQYQSIPQALEKLAAGTLDALLVPALEAQALVVHLYPGILKVINKPLNNKGLRLITLKGEYPQLIAHFNAGLKTLEQNGTYSQLRMYYGLN